MASHRGPNVVAAMRGLRCDVPEAREREEDGSDREHGQQGEKRARLVAEPVDDRSDPQGHEHPRLAGHAVAGMADAEELGRRKPMAAKMNGGPPPDRPPIEQEEDERRDDRRRDQSGCQVRARGGVHGGAGLPG